MTPMEEKQYHHLNPARKPLYIMATLIVTFVVIPALAFLYYRAALDRPAQCTEEKTFVIEKGEGASSVSKRLYDEGLINSQTLFSAYLIVNNLQSKLQAGNYTIPAGCSVKKLAEIFQRGRNDLKVTFLEGWRAEEFAEEAAAKFRNVDYEKFVEQAQPFEGQLFPDTYEFNADVNETAIISAANENFISRTKDLLNADSAGKLGITVRDALTLASIVEREVRTSEDQKIVAGILLKRFKEGQLLGADATTQYAVGFAYVCAESATKNKCITSYGGSEHTPGKKLDWWPNSLSAEDLTNESPFNTRKVVGLPPAPISNPGISAIQAVISPTETDYYYYLTDSKGVTHYAKTLEEHNRNITQFLLN